MNVNQIRVSKGMTQQQLADALDVTRSTVAMWEAGNAVPRADKLPLLAKVLGCTIEDLFAPNQKAASAR